MGTTSLPPQVRRKHEVQRLVTRLCGPLWGPALVFFLRFVLGYRIERMRQIRAEFERLLEETRGPLLICANHLTMFDSFIIAWGLRSTWSYAANFNRLPWNTPERRNFAGNPLTRALSYFAKCIPITRGGPREEQALVLGRLGYLLERGDFAVVFPEGGRSRSGRVELDNAQWGVGRVVGGLPGCRVLCVYLRGRAQESWSRRPARGDRFDMLIAAIEPKSDSRGARRSRDIARQIVAQLARMERSVLDGRQ